MIQHYAPEPRLEPYSDFIQTDDTDFVPLTIYEMTDEEVEEYETECSVTISDETLSTIHRELRL